MAPSTQDIYDEKGFGGRQARGERPALLVIDFAVGFTADTASPLLCDCDAALAVTSQLLEAARDSGAPVIYTTVAYDETGRRAASVFIEKVPALALLEPGDRWSEIDPRVAPLPEETVITKLFTSAFFGTPLAEMLHGHRCDMVIVVGNSTSGCVRATVVDAMQHGFRVLVPREGVADRAAGAHEASLTDIDAKYGNVVSTEEALAALRKRPAPQPAAL